MLSVWNGIHSDAKHEHSTLHCFTVTSYTVSAFLTTFFTYGKHAQLISWILNTYFGYLLCGTLTIRLRRPCTTHLLAAVAWSRKYSLRTFCCSYRVDRHRSRRDDQPKFERSLLVCHSRPRHERYGSVAFCCAQICSLTWSSRTLHEFGKRTFWNIEIWWILSNNRRFKLLSRFWAKQENYNLLPQLIFIVVKLIKMQFLVVTCCKLWKISP